MAEETQQNKLAAAKKKLKEYWQRNSPRVPAGGNWNRKTNGSIPETATSGGCQSPGDSARDFHREGPTSSATLKDLEVRGSGQGAVTLQVNPPTSSSRWDWVPLCQLRQPTHTPALMIILSTSPPTP
uniref:Uncharacterized protein n=1 Tax=Pongo abelii TaxID=9601 RepID=A0A8I5YV93_PONAB